MRFRVWMPAGLAVRGSAFCASVPETRETSGRTDRSSRCYGRQTAAPVCECAKPRRQTKAVRTHLVALSLAVTVAIGS